MNKIKVNFPPLTNRIFRRIFLKAIGGNEEKLFRDYWRQKPFYVPNGSEGTLPAYTERDFMRDLARLDLEKLPSQSYKVTFKEEYMRKGQKPKSIDEAIKKVEKGGVLQLRMTHMSKELFQHIESFNWFYSLFEKWGSYLNAVIRPENSACTILYGAKDSSFGRHWDLGDVINFTFKGKKKWTIDANPTPEDAAKDVFEGKFGRDTPFSGPTVEYIVSTGDVLHLPYLSKHHVVSFEPSLTMSYGFSATNPAQILDLYWNEIVRKGMVYTAEPFPAMPSLFGPSSDATNRDRVKRVRATLKRLYKDMDEMLAILEGNRDSQKHSSWLRKK